LFVGHLFSGHLPSVCLRWAFVLRPFAECLPVRSSILQSI
jgi:hypothetical protein